MTFVQDAAYPLKRTVFLEGSQDIRSTKEGWDLNGRNALSTFICRLINFASTGCRGERDEVVSYWYRTKHLSNSSQTPLTRFFSKMTTTTTFQGMDPGSKSSSRYNGVCNFPCVHVILNLVCHAS